MDSSWERQRTTKVYLHPVRSSRMITAWPDLKIVDAPVGDDVTVGAVARGIAIAFGASGQPVDWRRSTVAFPDDDSPTVLFENRLDSGLVVSAVATAIGRPEPDWSLELSLRNDAGTPVDEEIWVIPRAGRETYMMGISNDGYCTYDPRIEAWGMIPAPEAQRREFVLDRRTVHLSASGHLDWRITRGNALASHLRGAFHTPVRLPAGGELQVRIGTRADAGNTTHSAMRALTQAEWRRVLGPAATHIDMLLPEHRVLARRLLIQCLQMLADYGESGTAPRQGGISRGVWPTEALELLGALDDFGFSDEVRGAFHYLARRQSSGPSGGEVISAQAPPWAGNTGAFLAGVSHHLIVSGDPDEGLSRAARAAYEWIRDRRLTPERAAASGQVSGLFPAAIATDWPDPSQSWTFTDAINVMGLRSYRDLLATSGDAAADEAGEVLDDYVRRLREQMDAQAPEVPPSGEILLSDELGRAQTDPPTSPYGLSGPATLLRSGVIRADDPRTWALYAYFEHRGLTHEGLTCLMTDSLTAHGQPADPWAGHTWYTTYSEKIWFDAELDRGNVGRAEEILRATLTHGISSEWQVSERYADNDPAFAPWQPNGSGSARILAMVRRWSGYRNDRPSIPDGDPMVDSRTIRAGTKDV